jgi:ADP-heptose:LPS heptosyltransferase
VSGRVLVARLDSAGDVLLAAPAVRAAVAAGSRVSVLCSRRGAAAAALLPGVDEVLVFDAPWVLADPAPVRPGALLRLVLRLRRRRFVTALILTSFHQSPLPLALLLRLAGIPRLAASSQDYPGSLLDLRVHLPDRLHEAERSAALAVAAGFPDCGAVLAVREDLPDVRALVGRGRYVVVHPGADAPARQWPAESARDTVVQLTARGRRVLVTGSVDEQSLTARVAGGAARDLGGRTTLAELAAVLRGADVLVAGNTGPAHLAAAVGTPVVSLFAPVVPAYRWQPYGVRTVLLGDQEADCADSRWRDCRLPGHPCLSQVPLAAVVAAVDALSGVAA